MSSNAFLIVTGAFAAALCGCAAPVQLTPYPGVNAQSLSLEYCQADGFRDVRVLGLQPDAGTYEELGYMTLAQASTSEFVYASIERQIEAARIQACQWGADAIIVMESQGSKSNTWGPVFGTTYHDDRDSRIVAIRFLESSSRHGNTGQQSGAPLSPIAAPRNESTINYRIDTAGMVRILIWDRRGELVRLLLAETREPGYYSETWDWCTEGRVCVRDDDYAWEVFHNDTLLDSGIVTVKWAPNQAFQRPGLRPAAER